MTLPRWRRFVSSDQQSVSATVTSGNPDTWPDAWVEVLGHMEPLDVTTWDPTSAGRNIQGTRMRIRSARTKWVIQSALGATNAGAASSVGFLVCCLFRGAGPVTDETKFFALLKNVLIGNPAIWAKLLEGETLNGLVSSGVEASIQLARHKVMGYSALSTVPTICEVVHNDIYLNENQWAGAVLMPYAGQGIVVSSTNDLITARTTEMRWRMESRAVAMRR